MVIKENEAAPVGAQESGQTCEIEFDISGMTCASCVSRIERKLKKTDGVASAAVNLATERATVTYDPVRIDAAKMVAAIEAAGYGATPRRTAAPQTIEGMTCVSCVRRASSPRA